MQSQQDRQNELTRSFLAAQLAGDRQGAVRLVLDAVRSGISPRALQVEVIASAQREIGRLWELNRVTIAQEHLATAIAHVSLAQLYGHAGQSPRNGWTVVLACVEGEHHELGPRIAADVLDEDGYDVRFLGANVPLEPMVSFVQSLRPNAICLSATMMFHLPALRAAIGRLRQIAPGTPILAGGWAIEQLGGAPEGAEWAGASADDLLARLSALRVEAA